MEVGKAIEKVAQVYDKEQKIGQNQQKSLWHSKKSGKTTLKKKHMAVSPQIRCKVFNKSLSLHIKSHNMGSTKLPIHDVFMFHNTHGYKFNRIPFVFQKMYPM